MTFAQEINPDFPSHLNPHEPQVSEFFELYLNLI